jgi:hypothetical protein
MDKSLEIFNKGLLLINNLIEAGTIPEVKTAIAVLMKTFSSGSQPTDAELDATEAFLDSQLDKFTAPLPPR